MKKTIICSLFIPMFIAFGGINSLEKKPKTNEICTTPVEFEKSENKFILDNVLVSNSLETKNISKYLKPVSLINFWASWCGPCQKELPTLDAINKTDKYTVVTINLGDKDTDINSIFNKLDIKKLPKLKLPDYKILEELKLSGLPATIVRTTTSDYVSIGVLKESTKKLEDWLSCLSK